MVVKCKIYCSLPVHCLFSHFKEAMKTQQIVGVLNVIFYIVGHSGRDEEGTVEAKRRTYRR